jgi:hypothetical protein
MKIALLSLALCLAAVTASAGDKKPADYPLTAHVLLSRNTAGGQTQWLDAVIDGRQVELEGQSGGVLALGDYKARILKGSYTETRPNSYDTYLQYEFLFPDGHTRPYFLVGLETTGATAPPVQP